MTNKQKTRRALIASCISLLLCVSMLLGTTYAWFTDSVTSVNNIISSGNLDLEVYYGDPAEEKSIMGVSELFDSVKLWEPGAVAYENLTVANLGTLALNYQMSINFTNENQTKDGYKLSDILQVGIVEGGCDTTLTREEILDDVDLWMGLVDYQSDIKELAAKTNDETVGIVIYWAPSSDDNNYNVNNAKETTDGKDHLHIDLGVTVVATQAMEEKDGFDETYDEKAEFPIVSSAALVSGATADLVITTTDPQIAKTSITVPKDAPAGTYSLTITEQEITTDENGNNVFKTDISLTKDGASVNGSGVTYTVEIQLDPMADIDSVYHIDEEIPDTNYTYDPLTGVLTFTTTSFSPFTVNYTLFATEVVVDNGKITHGFFEGVNPAELDASLLGDNSEYIAVDYVKNGVKHYAVSKRATTVIVGTTAGEHTFENGSYSVTEGPGNLWGVISALQSNEHSTVYILPGTYNEGTTVNVYSSMDIIGLGNKEDIKIVKTSSSSSNRHLFNCNGTKADYIEVTIRNMTLDATAKTTNSKDNAAVQSIRKTKVKCYDLDIIKGTGWDAVAFYVNGNNAIDGVKYPAYMYVENCALNTTRTFGIVTTSGSYKFYHNELTYNGTDYTNNSGSIKNTTLEWNDWEW